MQQCSRCQAQNHDNTSFCVNCGQPLAAAPPQAEQPPAQAQPQPTYAPNQGYQTTASPTPPQTTSGMAIIGLVLAFLIAPVGLIVSIVALARLGGSGKKGKGLSIAGIIISIISMIFSVFIIMAIIAATKSVSHSFSEEMSRVGSNVRETMNEEAVSGTGITNLEYSMAGLCAVVIESKLEVDSGYVYVSGDCTPTAEAALPKVCANDIEFLNDHPLACRQETDLSRLENAASASATVDFDGTYYGDDEDDGDLVLFGDTWRWYRSLENSSLDNYYYGTFTQSVGALRNNGWDYGTDWEPLYTFVLTHEGQVMAGEEMVRDDQMQWVVELETLTGDLDVRNVTAGSDLEFNKER